MMSSANNLSVSQCIPYTRSFYDFFYQPSTNKKCLALKQFMLSFFFFFFYKKFFKYVFLKNAGTLKNL